MFEVHVRVRRVAAGVARVKTGRAGHAVAEGRLYACRDTGEGKWAVRRGGGSCVLTESRHVNLCMCGVWIVFRLPWRS